WLAASVSRPMMDVPPTDCPSRDTLILAEKPSAHLTNLAEARACKPFLLRIVTSACWIWELLKWLARRRRMPRPDQVVPESTWLATEMYLRPASLARSTASTSGRSLRTPASLISIGRLTPA